MNMTLNLRRWWLIAADRTLQRIGINGCVGVLLLIASAVICLIARDLALHPLMPVEIPAAPALPSSTQATTSLRSVPPLPTEADALDAIHSIEQSVQANGLAWTQAEYRFNPLTEDSLATLSIRSTLKGPYSKIKKTIYMVLNKQPALALRELNLTRPNADTADVEAKILLIIYMADGWIQPVKAGHD